MLRSEIASNTKIGQEAARYMNHGGLVPDQVALAAVESWLDLYGDEFVLDGFPRTVGQAKALDEILANRNVSLTEVLWLELADPLIEERVKLRVVCADCGRSFRIGSWNVAHREDACPVCGGKLVTRHDDDPEKLVTRLIAYRENTVPLIAYYEHRNILHRIDGSHTPEEVYAQLVRARRQSEKEVTTTP